MRGDYIDKIAKRAKGPAPGEEGEGADVVVAVEKPSYGGVRKSALDDLAKILNVPEEAREDFDGAMTDLVKACMDDTESAEPKPDAEG
jgi:hypothetical protein